MMNVETISILGYGKMARAIAVGLNRKFNMEILGRDRDKIDKFIEDNNLERATALCSKSVNIDKKNIVIAIKPYALNEFVYDGVASCVFSIMAGVGLVKIKHAMNSSCYYRVMPNIASLIGCGVSLVYGDSPDHKLLDSIFGSLGKIIVVDKEEHINSGGAISSSGLAYLGLVAEALIDSGIREGLNLDLSRELVAGLFNSFGNLIEHKTANDIRYDTTSPSGTTIEGIKALEDGMVRSAFINAVREAHNKSKTMF